MGRNSRHGVDAYVVVDLWRVRPGKRDELERTLRELASQIQSHQSIRSVDFTRLTDDPDRYLAVFRYESEEARERFVETDELRESHLKLHDLWHLDSPVYRGRPIGG